MDNDAAASARDVVERGKLPWPKRYIVEPRPGISNARNAALHATTGAEWIAFIDDDEVVEPYWIQLLVATGTECDADLVGGPVSPLYEPGVPDWFINGGFSLRPRFRTGSCPPYMGTGNVLMRRKAIERIGEFDLRFGLSGGEDTDFFTRARKAGLRLIWCDEAIAYEKVRPERARMRYVLRRQYIDATHTSRIEAIHTPGLQVTSRRACKGLARIIQGSLMLVLALPFGKAHVVRALQKMSLGAGMLGGLLNITIQQYQRRHSMRGVDLCRKS